MTMLDPITVTSDDEKSTPVEMPEQGRKKFKKNVAQSAPAKSAERVRRSKKIYKTDDDAHASLNFAEYMLSSLTEYAERDKHLYQWTGNYWKLMEDADGESEASDFLSSHFRDKASAQAAKDAWKYALMRMRKEKKLPDAPENKETVIIPVINGYLHVEKDGRIMMHEPDMKLGITYRVKATAGTRHGCEHKPQPVPSDTMFAKFLNSSLPDLSIRALVQEQCALSLVQRVHQLAFWWFGTGQNGKGTMTNIMGMFHDTFATVSLHSLNELEMADVCAASIILTGEVDGSKPWNEVQWKKLMGGNPITGRKLYANPITFINKSTHFISSNDMPRVQDTSEGVYRRLCFVHWKTSVSDVDKVANLEEQIMQREAHIVLDWLLEGVRRIVMRGHFIAEKDWPEETKELKKTIRYGSDNMMSWAVSNGVTINDDVDGYYPKRLIYENYSKWCSVERIEALREAQFWTRLWGMARFSAKRPTSASSTKRDWGGEGRVPVVWLKIDKEQEEKAVTKKKKEPVIVHSEKDKASIERETEMNRVLPF